MITFSVAFLIAANGKERRALRQDHNRAWNEARFLSFEPRTPRTSVIRVDADGARTEVAAFENGLPLHAKAAGKDTAP